MKEKYQLKYDLISKSKLFEKASQLVFCQVYDYRIEQVIFFMNISSIYNSLLIYSSLYFHSNQLGVGRLHIRLYRPLVDWFLAYISQSVIFVKYSEMFFTRSFVHRVVPQLKGTNPVQTPELLPLPSRAQRKPSSRLERRWASPAAQDTSCTANPPSAASQGILLSGAERRLHAGVGTAMLRNKSDFVSRSRVLVYWANSVSL